MKNEDETINEKPKGNMLQNENREDEAPSEDSTVKPNTNPTHKPDENVDKQPSTIPNQHAKIKEEGNNK